MFNSHHYIIAQKSEDAVKILFISGSDFAKREITDSVFDLFAIKKKPEQEKPHSDFMIGGAARHLPSANQNGIIYRCSEKKSDQTKSLGLITRLLRDLSDH